MKLFVSLAVILRLHDVRAAKQDSGCPLSCTEELLLENVEELGVKMEQTKERIEKLIDQKAPFTSNPLEPYKWKSLMVSDLEENGWQLVFRASAGNGHSAYKAWTEGMNVSHEKPVSMERSYGLHYRHPNILSWYKLGIKYVRFAFYNHDRELAYVVFNGTGSGMDSWFAKDRVLSSSYSDLTSTASYNVFSISGDYRPEITNRRFLINTQYGGCDSDLGHMVSIENNPQKARAWDQHPLYPQFLYSTINSVDFWNRRQFGRADCLAIFIKFS